MRDWIVTTLGGGATALAIIVAIIGLAGAIGGAITSFFIAQKTVYVNSITAERMKWVTLLRGNIANLIGLITIVQSAKSSKDAVSVDKLRETFVSMNQLAKTIELQLNPEGCVDRSIIAILEALYASTGSKSQGNIDDITRALVIHSQWLLKDEWDRVKYEAKSAFGKVVYFAKRIKRKRKYKRLIASEEGLLILITRGQAVY